MSTLQKAEAAVWIASYPKSGNTWVQSVIRHAGRAYGFPDGDLDVYKLIADKRAPQIVRGVRPRVTKDPVTVLKTHAAYPSDGRLHPALRLSTAGFVYVMRNPLDMLLSYINFTRQQFEKRKDSAEYQQRLFIELLGFERAYSFDEWQQITLEDIPRDNLDHALKRFTEQKTMVPGMSGVAGGSWLSHCKSWHEARAQMPSVFLRYEDLLEDAGGFLALQKIFKFSDDEILSAVAAVNEKQRGMQYKVVFFNKMASYYFTQFFSPSCIKDFLDAMEPELRELGYDNLRGVPA